MASPLYARYVPPKQAATLEIFSHDSHEVEVSSGIDLGKKRKRKSREEEGLPGTILKKSKKQEHDLQYDDINEGHRRLQERGSVKARLVATHGLLAPSTNESAKVYGSKNATDSAQPEGAILATEQVVPDLAVVKSERKQKKKEKKKGQGLDGAHSDINVNEPKQAIPVKHTKVLSRFEKAVKSVAPAPDSVPSTAIEEHEVPELHGLVPLPQPQQPLETQAKPTYSTLPPWLADPILISASTSSSFEAFQLHHKLLKQLTLNQFTNALPAQCGVLSLLLPLETQHPGDVCVSAATGSGKTLAYVLPIVQSLSTRVVTKLRAVIVVPTRELVTQVRDVVQLCIPGTGLKIGTAVGSHSMKAEQEALVYKGQKYEPEGYNLLQDKANKRLNLDDDDFSDDSEDSHNDTFFDLLPDHVPDYSSKVDILICTPGRLVDHIRNTTGFTLASLDWLVVDEADRLLDQSFQEWTDVVLKALEAEAPRELSQILANDPLFPRVLYYWKKHKIRKVVLSATMTRDLNKLNSLKFWNPKMVIVESTRALAEEAHINTSTGAMMLPSNLLEFAVPVEEPSDKPLYLLQLLLKIFASTLPHKASSNGETAIENDAELRLGAIATDSTSDTEDASFSSSESSSVASSATPSLSDLHNRTDTFQQPMPSAISASKPSLRSHELSSPCPNALIFISSNESAHRLHHLISHLHPPFKSLIATLAKSTTSLQTKHVLASFRASRLRIIIATDRASRGLDLPKLENVINYSMPHSATSYVHRGGRTARAGRAGNVWTLVEGREAAWFWNVIAQGEEIQRNDGKVERYKLRDEAFMLEKRKEYLDALAMLKSDVEG